MKRVLLTFGTRPEAVKMAPVVRALRQSSHLEPLVCLTGQHREMVDQILPIFDVRPDFDLDVMSDNQTPSDVASAVFRQLPAVLESVRPDLVLVQGDTTTAMASAIATHYNRIPVGHVEAGLRTGNLEQPFPEEANRKIIGAIASLHFAPTSRAAAALMAESVDTGSIFMTGNTVVDALHFLLSKLPAPATSKRRLILVTAHRRESFGRPIENICRAIREIVRHHEDVEILYPVHPNPNVRAVAHAVLGDVDRVSLVEPLDYLDFVQALGRCYLALTDSGGVQEEAPVLGKPVLVMRTHTERPEAIEAGSAELVGTDEKAIVERASRLLDDPAAYAAMSRPTSPFGDGHAAPRIQQAIEEYLLAAEPDPLARVPVP